MSQYDLYHAFHQFRLKASDISLRDARYFLMTNDLRGGHGFRIKVSQNYANRLIVDILDDELMVLCKLFWHDIMFERLIDTGDGEFVGTLPRRKGLGAERLMRQDRENYRLNARRVS